MRRVLSICLMLIPMIVLAQGERPAWYDVNSRQLLYPSSEYFVGFANGFVHKGESIETAAARIKSDAQSDAAQNIQVHVKSVTLDAVQSAQERTSSGFNEEIRSFFQRRTETSTNMDIPNLKSAVWSDTKTGEVAVLVYTRRRDFVRYYDRQIESLLGKMEMAMERIQQQEQQGAQIKARATAEESLTICPQVEYAQKMMVLGDADATMDDLQMPRYSGIVKQLVSAIERLRHATAFFIKSHAVVDGKNYNLFEKELCGLLAEKGCHFTEERESADWVIDIDATIINTTHREGMAYFVYVDGTMTIHNGRTGKNVYNDRLSTLDANHYDGIKGGDFNVERATRIAYHETARVVANAILNLVQE